MKIQKNAIQISIILSIAILSVFWGCGKKGPPLPPEIKGQQIAAPFDLNYTLDGKKITLSWKHEIDKERAVIKPDGFKIFMAKKHLKSVLPVLSSLIKLHLLPVLPWNLSLKWKKDLNIISESGPLEQMV